MTIFAHIIGELRHGIRRIVGDAVTFQHPGVYPDAVTFSFQDHDPSVRADRIEVLF